VLHPPRRIPPGRAGGLPDSVEEEVLGLQLVGQPPVAVVPHEVVVVVRPQDRPVAVGTWDGRVVGLVPFGAHEAEELLVVWLLQLRDDALVCLGQVAGVALLTREGYPPGLTHTLW